MGKQWSKDFSSEALPVDGTDIVLFVSDVKTGQGIIQIGTVRKRSVWCDHYWKLLAWIDIPRVSDYTEK